MGVGVFFIFHECVGHLKNEIRVLRMEVVKSTPRRVIIWIRRSFKEYIYRMTVHIKQPIVLKLPI